MDRKGACRFRVSTVVRPQAARRILSKDRLIGPAKGSARTRREEEPVFSFYIFILLNCENSVINLPIFDLAYNTSLQIFKAFFYDTFISNQPCNKFGFIISNHIDIKFKKI